MYTFVMVDDEDVIKEKLLRLIDWESFGFSLAASFSDSSKALEYLKHNTVDLLITDIKMPQISGLKLAKYLCENSPKTQIILISAYRDFLYAVEAMKYGVRSYLTKPISTSTLKYELLLVHSYLDKTRTTPASQLGGKSLIGQAQEYICANYRRDITLEEVASYIGISPNYLSALFKQKSCSIIHF